MNKFLLSGGIISILVAVIHVLAIFGGVEYAKFFNAPPFLIQLLEEGSILVVFIAVGLFLFISIWGIYAFSGAGVVKKLPFLKTILFGVTSIYIFRGMVLFPIFIFASEKVNDFLIWSSTISLLIGVIHLIGFGKLWKSKVS